MQVKLKNVLYVVIVVVIIIVIVNCMYWCRDTKSITENNTAESTVETIIESITNKEEGTIDKEEIIIETETDKEVDTNQAVQPISLGEFKLTAYCPCEKCCGKWANNRPNGVTYGSIGEELKGGYSIAVDPKVIPYRTEVIINGHTYKAQDCGGLIKGNRIDIFFENHQSALDFGVQYAEVFVIPK